MAALRDGRPTIAIVGAGMAGLAAAHAAATAGARVVVFEANTGPGGRAHRLARTEFEHEGRHWGFDLEHGIHGVWRQYRNLRRLIDELGTSSELRDVGGQEFVAPATGGGYGAWDFASKVRGSRLPSPLANLRMFGAGDFAAQAIADRPWRWIPAAMALSHAFAFDGKDDIAEYDDISVAEYVASWPRYLQQLSSAITHSAFFRDPEEVSLAAYFTGLQGYFISDKRDTAFDVLNGDIQNGLWGPLCAHVRNSGGEVRFSEPVVDLSFAHGRCTEVVSKPKGKRRKRTKIDGLIVALDPPGFAKLAGDGPLKKAVGDAVIPTGIPSTIVRLWFNKDLPQDRPSTGVFADACADNFFWLHRLQAQFRLWHNETGGSALECHLYGPKATESKTLTDAFLITRTTAIAERGWPTLKDSVVYAHVLRNPANHVAFGPGVMARLPTVQTQLSNVAMCGDWIACDTPILYLERAMITGTDAARHVCDAVGAQTSAIPEQLAHHPPDVSIAVIREVFRTLKKHGLLPNPV
jgi:carotenoid phi-ring synthase / carotenoid chi-ring synthase